MVERTMGDTPYPEDSEPTHVWLARMLERPGPDGRKWTRSRFATALGLRDDAPVYRWLRGEVEPGGEYLRRMAGLFGESPPGLPGPPDADGLVEALQRLERIEAAIRELHSTADRQGEVLREAVQAIHLNQRSIGQLLAAVSPAPPAVSRSSRRDEQAP